MDRLKRLLQQVLKKPPTMSGITPFVTDIFITFLGTSVGEGTFGKVKLGKHILTGEKVFPLI